MHLTDVNPTAGTPPVQDGDGSDGLEGILTAEQLARRPSRPPDHAAESKALVTLARELAESPRTILQTLLDAALSLCGADSAGISFLERREGGDVFRWHATAGRFASYRDATIARNSSPCGTVLDRTAALLMRQPARYYDLRPIEPPVVEEALLIPFHRGSSPSTPTTCCGTCSAAARAERPASACTSATNSAPPTTG